LREPFNDNWRRGRELFTRTVKGLRRVVGWDLSDITSQNTRLCQQVYVEKESQEILSSCALTVSEDMFSEKLTVVVPKETFVSCGCNESFAPRDILDY